MNLDYSMKSKIVILHKYLAKLFESNHNLMIKCDSLWSVEFEMSLLKF